MTVHDIIPDSRSSALIYIDANIMRIQENVPLAPLTTFQVGGSARYFAEAKTIGEVQESLAYAGTRELPLLVLGGGSNLLISDRGWPGLVLRMGITGIEERTEGNKAHFQVGAGEEWDRFVALAVAHHYAGVECLSGIPGSAGATPVQNVGAYGQEVSETIQSVLTLDQKDGQLRELCNEACGFRYRTSIFNASQRGRFIIVRVTYALTMDGKPHIEYADLQRYFADRTVTPSLEETREAVLRIRAAKGMLITPGAEDCRSAGSFFKNPVLSPEQYDDVAKRAAIKGLEVPSYPALAAQKKISAAWLVEHSGFDKGYVSGHAAISRKHTLAIVNRGGATAADILALKNAIQQRVEEAWGVHLEPEPVFVGF